MNIGLLVPTNGYGGAEKLVERLDKGFSKKHNVYIIYYMDVKGESNYNDNVFFLDKSVDNAIIKRLIRIYRLNRIKKEKELNFCISFMEGPNLVNYLSGEKNCRKILTLHGNYSRSTFLKKNIVFKHIYKHIFKYVYSNVNKVITVSKKNRELFTDFYNLKNDNFNVIYNMVDKDEILIKCKEPIPKKYKALFDTKSIISISRLDENKCIYELILTFNELSKKEEINLILLGDGNDRKRLVELVDRLSLNDRVFFLGFKNNPYKYIASSSVLVLNSEYEALPNTIVESMICKTPVISTNAISGPSEIISDGSYELPSSLHEKSNCGMLIPVPKKNISSPFLKMALVEMLSNEKIRTHFIDQGFKKAMLFDTELILKQWDQIFNEK